MIVEATVGAHVIVEVHLPVEIRVTVVRVLDEDRGGVEWLAVERGTGAVDRLELRRLHQAQRRVVCGRVAGKGRAKPAAVPRAAVASGDDQTADQRQRRRAAVV